MHTDTDVTVELHGRWPIGYPKIHHAAGEVQVALSPRLRLRGDYHDVREQLLAVLDEMARQRTRPEVPA